MRELYHVPTDDDRRTTTLEPGELILSVEVPRVGRVHLPEGDGPQAFSFPLVGVAAARTGGETASRSPVWRPCRGSDGDSFAEATPLPGTAYKVEVAEALVRRARAAVA